MEEHPDPSRKEDLERLEGQLRRYARSFRYPPTPAKLWQVEPGPQREPVGRRKLAYGWIIAGAAAVFVLLILWFSVPTVRAQILEFIQIGNIRIFQVQPTPEATTVVTTTGVVTTRVLPTHTPLPSNLVSTLRDLAGEIPLSRAPDEVDYPVLLPDYPTGIGKPEYVFVQQVGEPVLILIWMDPGDPEQILFSLSTIPPGSYALEKNPPKEIQETKVNGQRAIWAKGPYVLSLKNGDITLRRLVTGSSLIWEKDGNTYRLETSLSMAEAIKIAGSLEPYSP